MKKVITKRIWINIAKSFKDAETFDEDYYLSMNPSERLEIMQFLRDIDYKFPKTNKYADRKRLRRSFKIIQQT